MAYLLNFIMFTPKHNKMKKNKFTLLIVLVAMMSFSCSNEKKSEKEEIQEELKEASPLHNEEDIVRLEDSLTLLWEGSAVGKKHDGSLKFREANLFVNESEGVYGGNFIVDMNSLEVLDLKGDDKASLEGHLMGTLEGKEDHFFDAKKYPNAALEIVHAERLTETNYTIYANLEIKGIKREISFLAKHAYDENNKVHHFATEQIKVDRTKYGIKFMSSNFFEGLGDKAISDEITFNVTTR